LGVASGERKHRGGLQGRRKTKDDQYH